MDKAKGIFSAVLSAVIFGFTPILARMTFDEGSNAVNVTMLRGLLSLPILFLICKFKKIDLKITKKQLLLIILCGGFGAGLTTILLYYSYNFISVGIATTLHFIYPALVAFISYLLFKENLDNYKKVAIFLTCIGIVMFMENNNGFNIKGIFLALLSGVTYTFYIISLDKSELKNIHYFKLSMYICLMTSIISGAFGFFNGSITFNLTIKGWVLTFIVSVLVSVGALSLFQIGVKYCGGIVTSVLSTLEPITSIVLGFLILGESLSVKKIIGCLLIITSILFITKKDD